MTKTIDAQTQLLSQARLEFRNIAATAYEKYLSSDEIRFLSDAINAGNQAILHQDICTPYEKLRDLNNISIFLRTRYERLGELRDLDQAIEKTLDAIEVARKVSDDHLSTQINNHGNMLELRFERLGQLEDLEKAIIQNQEAIKLAPHQLPWLSNLGVKLHSRYKWVGRLADLEQSLNIAREIIRLSSEDDKKLPTWLSKLAYGLNSLFRRLDRIEDLEESINLYRRIVELEPDNLTWLTNLGTQLQSRFVETNNLEDMDESIVMLWRARERTPPDAFQFPRRTAMLASSIGSRGEQTGSSKDLETAIELYRLAIQSTSTEDVLLSNYTSRLAFCLWKRHGSTGDQRDLDEAATFFEQAWNVENGLPATRIISAKFYAQILAQNGQYSQAYTTAKGALELLPLLNTRALARQDRQNTIQRFSGLASLACSMRLQSRENDVDDVQACIHEALETLEFGRGALLGLLFEDRTETHDLPRKYTEQLNRLRSKLNGKIPEDSFSTDILGKQHSPLETLQEFNAYVREIRLLPGFDRFMTSPNIEEMKRAALGGVIVVVNADEFRTDAFIINSESVRLLRLTDPGLCQLSAWADELPILTGSSNNATLGKRNGRYRKFLSWLWKSCVKHVIKELGYRFGLPDVDLPRIWWIGTGLVNSFPFHAARKHVGDSSIGTFRVALSSYVPTIRALIFAKSRAANVVADKEYQHRILIATMDTTPGLISLNGIKEEMAAIKTAVADTCEVTHYEQPDAEAVLTQLKGHDMFHYSGHGFSDSLDPAQSSLIFETSEDSSLTKVQDHLKVGRLLEAEFEPAVLAFLSACSTAENRNDRLADESIHSVSGFLAAGFRHVIGCLWSSSDEVCVEVAREFYCSLVLDLRRGTSDASFPRALHTAVGKIYATGLRDQVLVWAQFIHVGA